MDTTIRVVRPVVHKQPGFHKERDEITYSYRAFRFRGMETTDILVRIENGLIVDPLYYYNIHTKSWCKEDEEHFPQWKRSWRIHNESFKPINYTPEFIKNAIDDIFIDSI